MALNSTIHTFDIDLSDVDRGVYEALALRVARHPSESEEYLVTRVLAYCLEYAEGIGFSNGLAEPEEPTLFVRDLTGKIRVWIDIGAPDAARMHKAGKAAARVVVYTHRDPEKVMRQWSGERIHHAEALELYSVAPALVAAFVARLERRMTFALSVTSGHLYLTIDDEVLEGPVERHAFSGQEGALDQLGRGLEAGREWLRNHRVRHQPETGPVHRYLEGQNLYFRECRPWALATIVVDNDDLEAPFVTGA